MGRSIAVRHGPTVAWVASVADAAELMRTLARGSGGRAACADSPAEQRMAGRIVAVASELVELVGGETLAKGLRGQRAVGRRMPAALERACRVLDGAAALLRHPGAADSTLSKVRAWLDTDASTVNTFVGQDGAEHAGGSPLTLEVDFDYTCMMALSATSPLLRRSPCRMCRCSGPPSVPEVQSSLGLSCSPLLTFVRRARLRGPL
eukprot:5510179-Alexandrium_andersonii.AAC.1